MNAPIETSPHGGKADYWREKLMPFQRGFKLFPPWLRARGTGVERVEVVLPRNVRAGIGKLCPVEDARSVLYLAGFALLLCRHTAAEEILIAQPGPLFLRCPFNADWAVHHYLQKIKDEIEDAHKHRAVSFADIMSSLGIETHEARHLFCVGHAPGADIAGADFIHEPQLLLSIVGAKGMERALLCYDAGRCPPEFVRQLAEHYAIIVGEMVRDPEQSLGAIHFLPEAEESLVLDHFNRTANARARETTLHRLVEDQAAKSPDAVAVVYENRTLTYRELNEQANRLAAYLRESFGVKTGDLVGVLTGRSEHMIVALLGIIKAGAAYVAINPHHPWEMIDYMIDNASIKVLLVNSDTVASVATFGGELFILDVELESLTTPITNPAIRVDAGNLAYVIYTSGSSGRPKGVAVEHAAIVNTVLWRNDYYVVGDSDTNLQMPSFSFDSSVVDIFCFLAAGARLIIPDEELRMDPLYVRNLIESHGVTRLLATASYYKLLSGVVEGICGLRSVTVAGEATSPELVAEHHSHLPGVRFINEYGPTENAVCSTACELVEGEATVPIGSPIANVKVFILDEYMRPTPVGVPGEMYLGGGGLARCYINQPALTAECFVPNPFAVHYAERLYKTGDWACWRPDGMLEFHGRVDSQVKVRGFRIELNEIENVLRKYPGVEQVAALCKEDRAGDKYLAVYVGCQKQVEAIQLSAFLQNSLPYFMVPDVLMVERELRLNLNGKIDTAYLRCVDDFEHQTTADATPETPLETALVKLCADIFKQPEFRPNDNFFLIGANSLRVMEMVTRVRGELNLDIKFVDIYTYPTVRELAIKFGGDGPPSRARAADSPTRGDTGHTGIVEAT